LAGEIAVEGEPRVTTGRGELHAAVVNEDGRWLARQMEVLDNDGPASRPAKDDQIDALGRKGQPYLFTANGTGLSTAYGRV
jgi:hypothetical protein